MRHLVLPALDLCGINEPSNVKGAEILLDGTAAFADFDLCRVLSLQRG
jgi:hypothetical protein